VNLIPWPVIPTFACVKSESFVNVTKIGTFDTLLDPGTIVEFVDNSFLFQSSGNTPGASPVPISVRLTVSDSKMLAFLVTVSVKLMLSVICPTKIMSVSNSISVIF